VQLTAPPPGRSTRTPALTSMLVREMQKPEVLLAVHPAGEMQDVKSEGLSDRLSRTTVVLIRDVLFLYRLLRHSKTPWYVKGLLFFPVIYVCSPVQLIPNVIPVIGQLDDFFVIWVTKKFLSRLVDQTTRRECCDLAAAAELPFMKRLVLSDNDQLNLGRRGAV
jgi:uncharacterized membrane protein YkvA (DUF1232 family)